MCQLQGARSGTPKSHDAMSCQDGLTRLAMSCHVTTRRGFEYGVTSTVDDDVELSTTGPSASHRNGMGLEVEPTYT